MNRVSYLVLVCLMTLGLSACARPQTIAPPKVVTTTALPSPIPFVQQPSATQTLVPPPTPTETATVLPNVELTYPDSHYIAISGHKQAYPLSCEASAAVDWAAYFGVDIFESDFQFAMPISDNPDYGFCGEVLTDLWGQIPPHAYGVHAVPVADLLVKYGLPAKSINGWTLEQVKQKLAGGQAHPGLGNRQHGIQ